jgi:predicted nucleic acid-binding protein
MNTDEHGLKPNALSVSISVHLWLERFLLSFKESGCRHLLPDPKDHMVLELAIESRADFIVTFNARDFAGAAQFGIAVTAPGPFLAILGEKP